MIQHRYAAATKWRAGFCVAVLAIVSGCSATPVATPAAGVAEQAQSEAVISVAMTEGTNMSAALSPDGNTIIASIQGVLWSIPAAGGEAVALTEPEMDAQEPVFSPDGSLVAFYAFTGDTFAIWTIAPDGSNLVQRTGDEGDGRYPSFAPDGTSIIYSGDEMGGYSAWSIDLASGTKTQLTTAGDTGYATPTTPYFRGAGNLVYPTLSPDGSKLAYVVDGEADTLFVRDMAAPHATKALLARGVLGAPAWAPSGDALYVVGVASAATYLARVSLDGEVTPVVEEGDIFPFRPSVTADGSLLVTADGKIKTFPAAGGAAVETPFRATVAFSRPSYKRKSFAFADASPQKAVGVLDPVLSPDGSKAAFTAIGDLWTADLATGAVSMLTNDEAIDLSPSWSPDGKTLVFVSDRGGKADLWTLSLEDGKLTQLTDLTAPPNQPVWSPDGTKIAYLGGALASAFVGGTVDVLDVKTKTSIRLSDDLFGPSGPSWSPSGKTVAVVSRMPQNSRFREGNNALLLFPADGEGEAKWVVPVEHVSLGRRHWNRPAWNKRGEIVYRIDGELWSNTLGDDGVLGAQPFQIAQSGENPSWSADGSRLIFLDGPGLKIYDSASRVAHDSAVAVTWRRAIPDTSYTIRAGRLFSGREDSYQDNVDIIVRQSTIAEIRPAGSAPVVGVLIDASDKVVMPGLIEGHTHQSTSLGQSLSDLWFRYGISSVRETGGDPYEVLERREAEAAGRRPGPRVFAGGPLSEGARVSYGVSETVRTEEEAIETAALAGALGLDMVKSYVRQNYKVQKAFIAEAHRHGMSVSGHELYPAIANGVDQMEHVGATSRRGFSTKQSRTGRSYQDMVDLVAKSGLMITPTLALSTRNWQAGDQPTPAMEAVGRIYAAGGFIVAGTDSPFAEFATSLHREMLLLVGSGLTPAQALRATTWDSARMIGVESEIGSIEPGKIADILILDGDPLANITDTLKVDTLMKNGVVVFERTP